MPTSRIHRVHAGKASYESAMLGHGPQRYFRLLDHGAVAKDLSDNAANGAYAGAYTQLQSGPLARDSAAPTFFDGASGRVDLDSHAATLRGYAAGTVSAWIYPTSDSGNLESIIDLSQSADYDEFWLFSIRFDQAGNYLELIVRPPGGVDSLRWQSTLDFSTVLNQWTHVMVEGGAGGNAIYINGSAAAGAYITGNAGTTDWMSVVSAADLAGISGWKATKWFTGRIAEVGIWNSKQGAAVAKELYLIGKNGP